jgi:hypothetical protein
MGTQTADRQCRQPPGSRSAAADRAGIALGTYGWLLLAAAFALASAPPLIVARRLSSRADRLSDSIIGPGTGSRLRAGDT